MGLKVIEPFEKDGQVYGTVIAHNSGTVCLESDQTQKHGQAIIELQSLDAKRKAQQVAATRGIADPRLEFSQAPYAVDKDGDIVTDPIKQKTAAYRIDVKVTGRLV